jgi:hypothetical protein
MIALHYFLDRSTATSDLCHRGQFSLDELAAAPNLYPVKGAESRVVTVRVGDALETLKEGIGGDVDMVTLMARLAFICLS